MFLLSEFYFLTSLKPLYFVKLERFPYNRYYV